MNASLSTERALRKQGTRYMHTSTVKLCVSPIISSVLPQKSALLRLCRAETRLLVTACFHPAQASSLPVLPDLSYSLSSCVLRMVILCHIHHHSTTEVSSPLARSRKKETVLPDFYLSPVPFYKEWDNTTELHPWDPSLQENRDSQLSCWLL